MARPKTHHIDTHQILLTIYRETIERTAQIDAELAKPGSDFHDFQRLHGDRRASEWMPYKVDLLAGRRLTGAEAKAWSRAVLAMEIDGTIEIKGIRGASLRLTKKGRDAMR